MEQHIVTFKKEYQHFLEQTASLPSAITDAYDICNCLKETKDKAIYLISTKSDAAFYILKVTETTCKEDVEDEYRMLHAFAHPSLPYAVSYMEEGERKYFIREYIEGVSLTEYVEEHGPLGEKDAVYVTRDLCRVLEYLHAQDPPIIHRDIKPQNIILTPEKRCVLIDFGTARRYHHDMGKDTVYMGTEATAAPEQFGYMQTDIRSDIYSMGILLLYLCTGSFDTKDRTTIKDKRLARVISKCIRFDPSDRYASIHRLHRGLKNACRPLKRIVYIAFYSGLVLGLAMGLAFSHWVIPGAIPGDQVLATTNPETSPAVQSDILPEAVIFSSPLIEKAVRHELGVDEGTPVTEADLDRVTQILIYGTTIYDDWDNLTWHAVFQNDEDMGTVSSFDDILKMKNLTQLGLYNQQINDLTPLAETRISALGLGGNYITDVSPLAESEYITELILRGNPITDIQNLSQIRTLHFLDISNTYVSDITPLAECPIDKLYLVDTPIRNYAPLSDMVFLKSLRVSNLDASGITECVKLAWLTDLSIYRSLSDISPLLGLTRLTGLDLGDNNISSLEGIKHFTNIDYLCLVNNPISDISQLTQMEQMSGVNIAGLSIHDYTPLLQIPSLERIYCSPEQQESIGQIQGDADLTLIVN